MHAGFAVPRYRTEKPERSRDGRRFAIDTYNRPTPRPYFGGNLLGAESLLIDHFSLIPGRCVERHHIRLRYHNTICASRL
jgi:hypothetical protein